MFRYCLLIIVTFISVGVHSQTLSESKQKRRVIPMRLFDPHMVKFSNVMPFSAISVTNRTIVEEVVSVVDIEDSDSVAYYHSVAKKNGWMEGAGSPLTCEDTKHRYASFKFSKKNKAGHWTRCECIDGYGKSNPAGLGTYLVNPNDDKDQGVDQNWVEKLKEVTYWEFVGDPTGTRCIEERAYDKNENLVYSYFPIPIADDKVMGHYTDSYGEPVYLRNSETGEEAKYVIVESDKNGYEKEIYFIGEDGHSKKNNNGVYRTRFKYSKNGLKLSEKSCDITGEYTIDEWGNCGYEVQYNDKGYEIEATNYNQYGKPMKMPLKRAEDDVIRHKYKYDIWGRLIEDAFFTEDNMPDTNTYGIHKKRYGYNEHGLQTHIEYLDLNNKLRNDKYGIAEIKIEYDSLGRRLSFANYNQYGELTNNQNGFSCMSDSYYDDGLLKEEIGYITKTGKDSVVVYHFIRTNPLEYYEKIVNDNLTEYCKRDYHDNIIEVSYYDLNMTPKRCGKQGYAENFHKKTINYTYLARKSIVEESYYNVDGQTLVPPHILNSSYNRKITVNDSLNNTATRYFYVNDKLILNFQQRIDKNNWSRVVGEIALDVVGKKGRSHLEKALYFKASTNLTPKENIASISITNEFDEVAYAMSDDSNTPLVYSYVVGDTRMDENFKIISDMAEFRKKQVQAYIIEVYDSIALRYGLQSGDVIVQYGDWSRPTMSKYDSDNELILEIFRKNEENKKITVLRHVGGKEMKCIELMLPAGTPSDFGFYYHKFYYTEKEKQRYHRICRENGIISTYIKRKLNDDIVVARPYRINWGSGETRHMNLFDNGMTNESVILKLEMVDSVGISHFWHIGESVKEFDRLRNNENRRKLKLWYSGDMRTVKTISLHGQGESHYWLDGYFSVLTADDKLSKKIKSLSKMAREDDGYQMKFSFDEFVSMLKEKHSKDKTVIDDTYKGVTSVNIFSFFNSNELFNLIERIKKVEVEESFINGYASITKESLSNKNKYSAAIIYNQYAIILIEGDFSQVQLNKISNLLK